MGEQRVSKLSNKKAMQRFMKSLLNDTKALEYMLENDWFESDKKRLGAEQEMVLVNADNLKPATIATKVLKKMKDYPWVETELARFNLETNLTPREIKGTCFSQLHKENREKLNIIQDHLDEFNAKIVLTGILPTMRKHHLSMENLTPKKRYFALMQAINEQLIGNAYELRIVGIDELIVKHDSPLLEAVNTSFQVHLQVAPKDFVNYYNIAQTLAAPCMAIASNSPIVFGKRLWHESRIAMFQQSLDTRSSHEHMRERSPRVSFGVDWLKESIMEIYTEDIARFRPLIDSDIEEDSLRMIKKGKVPKLRALQVHNSTVYRWNRPCYGISENGKPHLRIENRVLPSGPTVNDEVANAAFWIGCMEGMFDKYKDIRNHISFIDVRDNFGKAARFGNDSTFTWFKNKKINACDLVLKELIPLARKGLEIYNVSKRDIDKYLNTISKRAEGHVNGARWQLRSYTNLLEKTNSDEALSVMTQAIITKQNTDRPVHTWKLAGLNDLSDYRPMGLKVEELMTTDLFTVNKDDILDFVIDLIKWKDLSIIPVENTKGKLIGVVTPERIFDIKSKRNKKEKKKITSVSDIMNKKPVVIDHDATVLEAMKMMQKKKSSYVLVVQKEELVGLLTERDFAQISGRLMERM